MVFFISIFSFLVLNLTRNSALFERRVADAAAQVEAGAVGAEQRQQTLHHVEGTVLLQCEFAMKHNQTLAARLLALVKADAIALSSPFAVALLLSAGGVPRFERAAFKEAVRAVERACTTAAQVSYSCWICVHCLRSFIELFCVCRKQTFFFKKTFCKMY